MRKKNIIKEKRKRSKTRRYSLNYSRIFGKQRNEMENKIKIFFYISLIFLILPLVTAQTYQQNKPLNLKVPFEVNGSIPSASAVCNISIDYPNGTYLKQNASMTNLNNGDFNITLLGSELNTIGVYEWRAFCCDGSQCAAGYDTFEITPSGFGAIGFGEGITLFIITIPILILAILFFIFSFKVSSFPAKLILMGLSLIFFVVLLLFSMITLGQMLGGFDVLIDSYSSFFWAALFLFVIVFIFLLLLLIKKAIELFKIKRGLI